MKKGNALICGAIISLILLVVFLWLQKTESKLLQLPSQWLAITVLPILIALFVGGFITRFKGFGVELETTLKAPVASLNLALTASDAVANIPGDEKRSFMYLKRLSFEKKQAARWLLFKSGRNNYYTTHEVENYLRELPNLEYFEIRSETGDIICFIPISEFKDSSQKDDESIDRDNIHKLIESIENGNVPIAFSDSAITLKVSSKQGLVDVLKLMRAEKVNFAAVVSPSGRYLGVVFANEVEEKIIDSVLALRAA
ncbi:hypothetical protein KAR91_06320 [Candidatus Pacearchaeota archaeon]|nr:hypothetical protein [Candidatus Pacearchaeota archaeon]